MPRGSRCGVKNVKLGDWRNIKPPKTLPFDIPKTSFAKLVFGFEQTGDGGLVHHRLLANHAALANLCCQKIMKGALAFKERLK